MEEPTEQTPTEQPTSIPFSRIFSENRIGTEKIILNRGGTRSGKTYSLVQLAFLWMTQAKGGPATVWSICRSTLPALKATAYRDFKEIVDNAGWWNYLETNYTDLQFSYGNRTIEFFSLDDEQKVRSRKRQHLHIVEANETDYKTFIQLAIRTKGRIFLDWNPDDPNHWIRMELEEKRAQTKKDVKVIVSSYLDNMFLTQQEVEEIEYLKEVDEELWQVYGTGEYGKLTDIIYKKHSIGVFPDDCEYLNICIDFGYTRDPAAVILLGKSGRNIHVKELIYETGLLNSKMADQIHRTGHGHLQGVADSAEPKSIAELNSYGLQIWKAKKGTDSIRAGIQRVREFNLVIDPGSVNIIKEVRAYKWSDKKAGVPIDKYNHAMDAIRYGVTKFHGSDGGISVAGVASNYSEREL